MASAALFKPGFLDFYRHGHFSDVTILTQSRTYRAHRMVLAFSSEFFEAMLLGEFQETQTAVIDMRNMFDPREIFPEVLKILYSGRIDITPSTAVPLLAMSDVLLISSIQNKCNDYIATHLNKKTALEFLLQYVSFVSSFLILDAIILREKFANTNFQFASSFDLSTHIQLLTFFEPLKEPSNFIKNVLRANALRYSRATSFIFAMTPIFLVWIWRHSYSSSVMSVWR